MAPSRTFRVSSGTTNRSSKNRSCPNPSHSGHAPKGALNENRRGSISEIVKPLTGHAKFSLKVTRSGSPSSGAVSKMAIPSARSSAVRKLSARRVSMPARTTILSTTTSMWVLMWRMSSSSPLTQSQRMRVSLTRRPTLQMKRVRSQAPDTHTPDVSVISICCQRHVETFSLCLGKNIFVPYLIICYYCH